MIMGTNEQANECEEFSRLWQKSWLTRIYKRTALILAIYLVAFLVSAHQSSPAALNTRSDRGSCVCTIMGFVTAMYMFYCCCFKSTAPLSKSGKNNSTFAF
jgi:hypothetical protein